MNVCFFPQTDSHVSCNNQNWLFIDSVGEIVIFIHCFPESSWIALQNWGNVPALVLTREENTFVSMKRSATHDFRLPVACYTAALIVR